MRNALTTIVLLLVLCFPQVSAAEWAVEVLGPLNGRPTTASAMNDRGEVVGYSWNEQGTQIPFVWTQKAGYRTFLGDSTGFATDINNRGDVVGVRLEGLGAFLWNETTGLVDLGAGFWPLGINNSGVVVGGCNGVTPEETGPCVWTNGVRTGTNERLRRSGAGYQ